MRANQLTVGLTLMACACTTAGTAWMEEPLYPDDETQGPPPPAPSAAPRERHLAVEAKVIGGDPENQKIEGRILGTFRNTYYDFPSESDYSGALVPLMNARCEQIQRVPQEFHDRVCVQGSGTLKAGRTVSFNRRNCECARECPRTKQKICFDALDPKRFPWGRGAAGKPITPLLTIAADTTVLAMGTPVFIPEFVGAPRDPNGGALHDGCFIVQDRGSKVKGKHVDIFTGHESMTKAWNALRPSNAGVTVVLDNPRCARAAVPKLPPRPRDDD